ncbi:hypothetical protein [Mesorhizobium sp. J428]|uniref:hypothetical protein n=1 Tax=Mesorhizobium sp. J428 TaxID=2898440 RepID=UPI00215149C2|nr:hypothetical protein [Mesorhizobium sp. J428]MCR5856217.1 hypothetical protein [Mesorhizobium sp. J428]
MLKLAFLLVGPEAFRARWYVLAILGGLFMALAALLAIDAVDGVTAVTQETMGGVFVVNGVLTLLGVLGGGAEGRLRNLALAKAAGLIVLGCLILGFPFKTDIALVVLFSLTFALDGLGRIATANLVRFSGWRTTVAIGIAELLVAVLILTDWPLPDNRDIPFCISLLMALTGWLLVRVSLMFRTLESEAAILLLPIFGGRGWVRQCTGADRHGRRREGRESDDRPCLDTGGLGLRAGAAAPHRPLHRGGGRQRRDLHRPFGTGDAAGRLYQPLSGQ